MSEPQRVCCYIQPARTFTPTTGAGKHINQTVLGLNAISGVNCELLCSKEWCVDGLLPLNCPLRSLKTRTYPFKERHAEWMWKLACLPKIDNFIGDCDWIYSPSEALLPCDKVPVAITVYDVHPLDPLYPIDAPVMRRIQYLRWKIWLPRAIRRSTIVFTISEFSKERMVELLGVDPCKIKVVGCGVEPAFFQCNVSREQPESVRALRPYVIVVGGLSYRKAGDKILEVARHLEKMRCPLHIVVAGTNQAQYARDAAALKNVTLLGKVPDTDLPGIVAGAASLLMLSRYEGFGIPPAEAMAAGVPVVVSDTASLPEVVVDAGVVVPLNETRIAAEQLNLLLTDTEHRTRTVAAGLQRAKAFTWDKVAERIYTQLFGATLNA